MWVVSPEIVRSKSRFVGRIAPVFSLKQARELVRALKSETKATHNISAARVRQGTNILEESNDNDERPAGRKLFQVLRTAEATNVVLVVSRWYGGQKLGSERFRVIDGVAQDVIQQSKSSK